jgi:hypothetical protein
MPTLSLILGILCLLYALLDAFQTVILPRRPSGAFRLTGAFYVATWTPWKFLALRIHKPRKRETMLSIYGPLSLVLLIAVWAVAVMAGFALIFYGLGSPFHDPLQLHPLHSDFYVSGTTLFTLGLGDVTPNSWLVRTLIVLEAGIGLGFVALVIGYFPVLYGAFSRREVNISLLDARAGSPPSAAELLRRHAFDGGEDALIQLLEKWESWSAELLESHISYPLLCYFRSQHANQSWLSALVAILDACALLISGIQEKPARQAQLTFAMARHALIDLSQIFSLEPCTRMPDRLPHESFQRLHDQLCAEGVRICRDGDIEVRLRKMRALYEGYAHPLADHLCMTLPPFITDRPRKDNWQNVARLRAEAESALANEPQGRAHTHFPDDSEHLF